MNAKQSKRARALANKEAKRQNLWQKGSSELYRVWWRRLLAKLFPRARVKYTDIVGRWYKRTLKNWAKQAAASIHDKDLQAFERARAKLARHAQWEKFRAFKAQQGDSK